jgi:ATP-dependent Clp protease ATP-binding subunit ClpC
LRRHFPPEFINRLDEVIVFGALDQESMLEVAGILLAETAEVLARQNVSIDFEAEVSTWLLDQCGMDPQSGARPMRRLIKLWVEDAVADFLIQNRGAANSHLKMRVEGGRPVVETSDKDVVAQGADSR